jgi:hypothetical protein
MLHLSGQQKFITLSLYETRFSSESIGGAVIPVD